MLDHKNLLITVFLSTLVLLGWQYFVENPNVEKANQTKQEQIINQKKIQEKLPEIILDRSAIIDSSKTNRLIIENSNLKGSINLQGFVIDDLSLQNYKETIDNNSDNVILLSPQNSKESYFGTFDWISDDSNLELPNSSTIWVANKSSLRSNESVTLKWQNQQNILFNIVLTLDDNYMFTINQSIVNNSQNPISITHHGEITRKIEKVPTSQSILHEGIIASFKGILFEKSYEDLKKSEIKKFNENQRGDWLGITDKYWLTAIMPQKTFSTKIINEKKDNQNIFQINYFSEPSSIMPNEKSDNKLYFFAGAKNLKQLDQYANNYQINLFDRAVDFGWFYFLTKPIFLAIQFLSIITGNFGIAILLLTVIIKLIMFPLANKSFHSMNKMKSLAPELTKLKERYEDDKMQLNKATMELYKKENINPLSGCLPLILQIPVFFSLYKVLFVTIEMRHAPFFGWIHDLSAPDPTSIFNLFGLIPWNPPEFLMIGAWPIIMAITMYIQQKLSPQPNDPMQAKLMKFLPLFFVFMFGSFPAGLVIYWAWNNILSVFQQLMIDKKIINK